MANVLLNENVSSNKYKLQVVPMWGRAAPRQHYHIHRFVGREGEDIRMYDHATGQYVPQQGPVIEMILAPMSKNDWKALKDAAKDLSGTVIVRQVRGKEISGHGQPQVYAGALWLP